MNIPYTQPVPAGSRRARDAKKLRDLATEVSRLHTQALTKANGEENEHSPCKHEYECKIKKGKKTITKKCEMTIDRSYPANFTKGLAHDENGIVNNPEDYHCFVQAINSEDSSLFDKHVPNPKDHDEDFEFHCKKKEDCCPVNWRGWESPRAGHVYELQGPDAGAVGMAPAPKVGSSELAAEMAEVYSLALLRDVPFTEMACGGGKKICKDKDHPNAELTTDEIINELNHMPYFSLTGVTSSTPHQAKLKGLNRFEFNRREARTDGNVSGSLNRNNIFRGSAKGSTIGPYISQFLLVGNDSLNQAMGPGGTPSSIYKADQGYINYGNQVIDQQSNFHKACLDHMTEWLAGWMYKTGPTLQA